MNFTNPKVELDVFHKQADAAFGHTEFDHPKEIAVTFDVELECRSWGIKGVDVFPRGTVTIPLTVTDYQPGGPDDGVVSERTVDVDVSRLFLEYTAGGGCIMVTEVNLHLNADFSVDYKKSEIVVQR